MVVCCNFTEYKVKMSDFACFVVIAIKRQWWLNCILKFEGFAKTIDFPLCRDLHRNNKPFRWLVVVFESEALSGSES